MKLPFGKHKGEDITDVPTQYLCWLEIQDFIRQDLREAVQFEIRRRRSDVTSLGRDVKK